MKLSELKTGEKGVIVKVLGHGGFRKRIIEMGFIKGQVIEVLQNAPLQDPVKYRIMGYEVSLRHHEADQVEVVADIAYSEQLPPAILKGHEEDYLHHEALRERRVIHVALVGNPNCGKTSLFNYASGAHAHVGNYSGVTVDATEAHASMFGYEFMLTDLPGTYSLSCYSPEELYVRKHLSEQMPDVVINVVDASNLERNLYLTTQLVDMNVRMVCALNMYDEFERRGDKLDIPTLSSLFGMPMIPTSFKSGRGLKELFRAVIQVYEGKQGSARHLHINYGHEIEQGISHIQHFLKKDEHITQHYSTRYLAIKLLEHDSEALRYIGQHLSEEHRPEDRRQLLSARDKAASRVQDETGTDSETAIMDAKYGFINGALKEAGYVTGKQEDTYRTTHRIDAVLSHKIWGFPVFFAILFVMFHTTFILGQYPMDWIEAGVEWLGEWIGATMSEGPMRSMLVDGVIGARAAFIMDRLMHKMGLHGKSFIPLVMGFGCNVPAVMATRTIESRRSRLITMMILPLMSCSARLPIYIMIIGTFFAVEYQSWVMISLYLIGIILSVVVSKVFSTFIIKGEDTPFVMELPPYRFPTLRAVMRHTWEKGKEYLKKMGGVILVASILVWALGYFSFTGVAESMENSIIGRLGQAVAPVFSVQGFNWQLDVSLMAGVGAKEIVASTIGVLGGLESLTVLQAYCYLLFVLIYFPCIATIIAIKNETGSWRWAFVSAVYTTCLAWVVSAVVYQVGLLFS